MALTKAEKRKLKKQKRQVERQEQVSASKKKSTTRNIAIGIIVVLIVAYGIFSIVSAKALPGYYDDFASCLADKGMVIYGADWCTYTAGQLQMFGKSKELLDYRDFAETTGVSTTPTWEFEGERYPRAQTMERLSEISGCKLSEQ